MKSHCTNGAGAALMPPESPRTGLSPEFWRSGAGGYRGPQAAPAGAAPACSRQAGQFEQQCKTRGIRLFALPLRSPELNGSVERARSITRLFVHRRQRAIHLILLAPPPPHTPRRRVNIQKHPHADVRVFCSIRRGYGWGTGVGDFRREGVSVPIPSDSLSPIA